MIVRSPTIAIIGGTGKEGRGLALRWAAAGYKIVIGSRDQAKATLAADEINQILCLLTVTGELNSNAVMNADICVLTVIPSAHQSVLEDLKEALHDKILVDATSRVDYKDPKPPDPPCAAQRAKEMLDPSMKIVAAFQNVPAKLLSKNPGEFMDADVLVCADDLDAAEQVIQIAEAAGMRGFYAGGLVNANVVEGITSILISLNKHYGINNASIRVAGIENKIAPRL